MSKPRVVRLLLSRCRVRWQVILIAPDGLSAHVVGFKRQTQFKTFGCACFIAGCVELSGGVVEV